MAVFAFTRDTAVADSGNIYYQDIAGSPFSLQTLPVGIKGARVRPSIVKYKGRTYVYGMFSAPVVITETRRIWQAGVPAPTGKPTLTAGSSSGGSTGIGIGYLTFLEKDVGRVIQESNPSTPSASVSVTGQGFSWTNLPTTSVNARVTHIRGYRSMDGSIPGLVWERQLGVTSVSENVPTDQLGERLPILEGLDGAFDVDVFGRGVPPNGRFAEVYHDALWVAGDYDHPTRVYYSRLFEPESFNTVQKDNGWFDTRDGEAVTGLKRWGDLLIVGCLRACYAIQGFDSGDYQMVKLSNYYGVLSHHSMVRVGPNSDLWAAGQEGVWLFNGSFRDLMKSDLRNHWRDDYRANKLLYEDCFAAEDRFARTYQLAIPQAAGADQQTFKYIGHWADVQEGSDPWWTFDRRTRQDSAIGTLLIGDDDHYGELLTGSCDGFIRKENVESDDDDDGDAFAKAMTITTKHYFFGDQSGDDAHGRSYTGLDLFLKNENTAVTVAAYAGDDTANQAVSPQWSHVVPADASSDPRPRVPRTSKHVDGLAQVNGKGVTLKFTATSPVGVSFRGFGIYHVPGHQERPFSA